MLSERHKGHLSVLLFTLLISTSFPLGQYLTAELPPLVVTWSRFVLGGVFFAGLLLVRRSWQWPPASVLLRYAVLSLLVCFYFWSMFEALEQSDPVEVAAIYTLVPLFTAMIARVAGQHLKQRQWVMLLIGLLAAVWIIVGGSVDRLLTLRIDEGSLIYLWGCMAFAANPVLVQSGLKEQPILSSTFWLLLFAALWLSPFIPMYLDVSAVAEVSEGIIWGVLYMGLVVTALTFMLFHYASVRLKSAQVMAYSYLVPVMVMLMAVGAGQPLVLSILPAVGIILAVVVVMLKTPEDAIPAPVDASPEAG
ncbi:DMT family transporter [Pontibacterium granulatum]|uniref:DMT family transporter n=1 Tax=Pontibacterium granulatum TaxID=2036029 RepID=UPI00249A1339|nr:DMT family transporter [Pontibacterium granulatum]MDI3326402.1 DMT family transporter [Pontibacterium granulatum]